VSSSEVGSWQLGYFDLRLVGLLIVSVSVEIGFVGLGELGHWTFSFVPFRHKISRRNSLSMGYVLNALALTFS
jgi:hypothetical protein